MKKVLPILVIGILTIGGFGAFAESFDGKNNIENEKINFSEPIIKVDNNYATIDLNEKTTFTWETNKPMLPVLTKVYTYPFGTNIEKVNVKFSDTIEKDLSIPVKPVHKTQMKSIYASHKVEEYNDIIDYSNIDIYPNVQYSYRTGVGLKNLDHVTILTVHLYPIQYVPNENKIKYSKTAIIDISYSLTENTIDFQDEYDFLIITYDNFKSALEPLAELKNQDGINTKIVTLSEVYDGTYFEVQGIDAPEKIKYFIKNALENWNIHYLLLVGSGVEGVEKFPVRYAYIPDPPHEEQFGSVLYYADIYKDGGEFEDWDSNGNGVFAEWSGDLRDDIDLYPDVCLGLIPCNNKREVKTIVNKIINYKAHNKITNKIVQVGGDTFPGDPEGVFEGEFANECVMKVLPGYNATRYWASEERITKRNIAKGFKSSVDFIDFSGHGGTSVWGTHPPEDKKNWVPEATLRSPTIYFTKIDFDLYFVNNKMKLPVVVYNACSNNKWTRDEQCLGYKTLSKKNGGGIASYAASALGFGYHGSQECDRRWGWCEVHTFEGLYNDKILGNVWNDVITNYVDNFSSLSWDRIDQKTMLGYSMFGDPTLAIQDGDDPVCLPDNRPLYTLLERLFDIFPKMVNFLEQIL
jgi:hypothetical protein